MVGIAASGTTPYVGSALQEARAQGVGARTVFLFALSTAFLTVRREL